MSALLPSSTGHRYADPMAVGASSTRNDAAVAAAAAAAAIAAQSLRACFASRELHAQPNS